MKIKTEDFRVRQGKKVELSKWPTGVKPVYSSKKDYKKMLASQKEEMAEEQAKLYSHDRYSLLLVFQAMDAAGKDGSIKHVMSGINPQGCQVFSFKQPSSEELDHDFLWRTTRRLPERGRIGIFNRSYYEEVLIVKVHPGILDSRKLPQECRDLKHFWQGRYKSIRDLESHLHRNGTRIVKFFLHLSKQEQMERFLARIDEPDKNWKFSMADVEERKYWEQYQEAYAACLEATSTRDSPWYVVPADDKKNARLIVSEILLDTLKSLPLAYPETSPERRQELLRIREDLSGD